MRRIPPSHRERRPLHPLGSPRTPNPPSQLHTPSLYSTLVNSPLRDRSPGRPYAGVKERIPGSPITGGCGAHRAPPTPGTGARKGIPPSRGFALASLFSRRSPVGRADHGRGGIYSWRRPQPDGRRRRRPQPFSNTETMRKRPGRPLRGHAGGGPAPPAQESRVETTAVVGTRARRTPGVLGVRTSGSCPSGWRERRWRSARGPPGQTWRALQRPRRSRGRYGRSLRGARRRWCVGGKDTVGVGPPVTGTRTVSPVGLITRPERRHGRNFLFAGRDARAAVLRAARPCKPSRASPSSVRGPFQRASPPPPPTTRLRHPPPPLAGG